jgi:CubicO group peptidase (beta-lactamase class C family)
MMKKRIFFAAFITAMNKMFTAIAIMQLVQQGKLAVDDKIVQHIPDYPNQKVANNVTIHHLLTHTSGLGDFFTNEFFETSRDQIRTLTDYLALFVDRPLQFEPGARLSYSNEG